ncbi:MAG: superoxide dismutase [Pseudotabrizicola sp.]|uniref:superoxide dismutase n=1 Tax=Pseudotabrizicola sp. TaxID=2939647 RepID=UPI00271FCD43|nr:superoxide dismutase [Pseudotabrizicola sp.]MDO9640263.1 superoxide dismutase [Pseudotabrizicola sp.]
MKHTMSIVALSVLPLAAMAQTETTPAEGAFTLPDLPYAAGALDPVISAETMELHHGRHHQSFVDTLNDEAPAGVSLEDLVANAGTYPDVIRNNAGGHWNHSFFWETMAPADSVGEMSEALSQAITTVYGSQQEFQTAFQDAGAGQFGSGWVWLIINEQDQLQITTTPNQDNPLMDVAEVQGTPLLGNDVWEHAYYLTYNNRRADYLESWWDVVNWAEVSDRYSAALAE